MHTVTARATIVIAAMIACGGRTSLDAPAADNLDFPPHPTCASASGVRICGAGCPPLDLSQCKGYGCTDAIDDDGATATAGICWSDTRETNFLCDNCDTGDACLARTDDRLECVPADVCAALWDRGETNVCRYADKRRYDHQQLPVGTGCPSKAGEWHACGGDCPTCPDGTRCDGVSPYHPFGICHGAFNSISPYDPNVVCSNPAFCGTGGVNMVCAVLNVPDADLVVAFQYGICMDPKSCADFASRFPGGLTCYDAAMHRVAP